MARPRPEIHAELIQTEDLALGITDGGQAADAWVRATALLLQAAARRREREDNSLSPPIERRKHGGT